MGQDMVTGEVRALGSRGISEETCRKFGYRIGQHKGRTVQIAEYRGEDGSVVAQHLRGADKAFSWVGDAGQAGLFGAHLWPGHGRRVVVTEGEIDALSVAQAFGLSWPVVSIPNGAQNARKAVQKALEWLEGYEQVVFCFDMDKPGREAAVECASLLSPGKAAICEMPVKDANDLLRESGVKEVCSAIYQARIYRPDGIVTLAEIEDRVLSIPEMGRPYPFPGATAATYGRRLGEVIGLGGGSGCGKTDLITEMVKMDVVDLQVMTGILSLEQPVADTGKRLAGKMAGKRFHVPDGSWTQSELAKSWGELKDCNRLHLYDNFGAMDWQTIKSKIRYMVTGLGCQHIYLDHLTAMAAMEDDEKKALERIMAEAAGMAKGLNFILHYVSHLATPEGKPHEEGGRVMGKHFKGSRAIIFWSHTLWGLERDTQSRGSPTTLRCLKHRFEGQATGQTWDLAYDHATGRLAEASPFGNEEEQVAGNDF